MTSLNDSEIPDVFLKGCKTPAPTFVRVIATGILCWVMYVMSAGMAQSLLQRIGLSLPLVAMFVACVVVYISASPIYDFVTSNLRNCSQYYRFKQLFRDEFNRKDVTRGLALRQAETRLNRELTRRRHGQRGGFGVQQYVN